jgi:hypothetical protein
MSRPTSRKLAGLSDAELRTYQPLCPATWRALEYRLDARRYLRILPTAIEIGYSYRRLQHLAAHDPAVFDDLYTVFDLMVNDDLLCRERFYYAVRIALRALCATGRESLIAYMESRDRTSAAAQVIASWVLAEGHEQWADRCFKWLAENQPSPYPTISRSAAISARLPEIWVWEMTCPHLPTLDQLALILQLPNIDVEQRGVLNDYLDPNHMSYPTWPLAYLKHKPSYEQKVLELSTGEPSAAATQELIRCEEWDKLTHPVGDLDSRLYESDGAERMLCTHPGLAFWMRDDWSADRIARIAAVWCEARCDLSPLFVHAAAAYEVCQARLRSVSTHVRNEYSAVIAQQLEPLTSSRPHLTKWMLLHGFVCERDISTYALEPYCDRDANSRALYTACGMVNDGYYTDAAASPATQRFFAIMSGLPPELVAHTCACLSDVPLEAHRLMTWSSFVIGHELMWPPAEYEF